jgi:membrane-associated phospholipid phosphatase
MAETSVEANAVHPKEEMRSHSGAAASATRLWANDKTFRWFALIGVAGADVFWMSVSHYSVTGWRSPLLMLAGLAGLMLLAALGRLPRYSDVSQAPLAQNAIQTLRLCLLLALFGMAASVLQYLLITLKIPVVDARLEAADLWLGFDWKRCYLWVHRMPAVNGVLELAYASLFAQLLAVQAILGLRGKLAHLHEFLTSVVLSSLLLLIVSAFFPAHSAFIYYWMGTEEQLQSVAHFDLLREGLMQAINLDNLQGLISIPSYHTALAVILTYAMRSNRPLLIAFGVLNALMVLSTPTAGGHYLVDTLAGLLLAWCSIAIVRRYLPAQGV